MAILQNYTEGDHTQLNKLKYGDTATIGNEPIVQKTIPTDFNQQGPSSNQVSKRVDDLKRIGTILTQKPGLKYLANETALNAAKVTPKTGNIFNKIGANLFNSVKIIGSTLLQVPLNGTGTHFVKGFAGKDKNTYMSGLGIAPHTLARQSGIVFNDIPIDAENIGEETSGGKSIEGGILKDLQSPTQIDLAAANKIYSGSLGSSNSIKKEVRIGTGTPFIRRAQRLKPADSTRDRSLRNSQDLINMLPASDSKPNGLTGETGRDLIKFRFQVVTPESTTHLYFRAYLDSLTDNFTGNWNSFNYAGRGESFHTYQGFDRQISLGFKIAAQTRWEMRPLYQKIVHLASATAPTYNEDGFMRGSLVKLTVGDYIYEVPGYLGSVNYTWNQDYPWEIAMTNPERGNDDIDLQELPMILDCQVNFTPIHTFVPQTGFNNFITNSEKINPEGNFLQYGIPWPQPGLEAKNSESSN